MAADPQKRAFGAKSFQEELLLFSAKCSLYLAATERSRLRERSALPDWRELALRQIEVCNLAMARMQFRLADTLRSVQPVVLEVIDGKAPGANGDLSGLDLSKLDTAKLKQECDSVLAQTEASNKLLKSAFKNAPRWLTAVPPGERDEPGDGDDDDGNDDNNDNDADGDGDGDCPMALDANEQDRPELDLDKLDPAALKQEIQHAAYNDASDEALAHRTVVMGLVTVAGELLELASPELRDHQEIVLAALRTSPRALGFASSRFREDRDLVLLLVTKQGYALEFVAPRYRADKEVVMAAVRSADWALQFASPTLCDDRDVVMTALERQAYFQDFEDNVFRFASERLQGDRDLVLQAVKTNIFGLDYASGELKEDKDFVLQVFRRSHESELEACYSRVVADSVRQAATLDEFVGAAKSVLACKGDPAPVITVSLADSPGQDSNTLRCVAFLVSGAQLEVEVPAFIRLEEEGEEKGEGEGEGECEGEGEGEEGKEEAAARGEEEGEPPTKRRRVDDDNDEATNCRASKTEVPEAQEGSADQTSSQRPVTMAYLAEALLSELTKHVETNPRPERLFLLVRGLGESGSKPVSPWDWDRTVLDFCPAA